MIAPGDTLAADEGDGVEPELATLLGSLALFFPPFPVGSTPRAS